MGRLKKARKRLVEALSQQIPRHFQPPSPFPEVAAKAQNAEDKANSHLWKLKRGSLRLLGVLFRSNCSPAPGIRRLKGGAA